MVQTSLSFEIRVRDEGFVPSLGTSGARSAADE